MSDTRPPRVCIDAEFHFTHGDPCFVGPIQEDDVCAVDDQRIRILRHLDPQTTEETIIQRAHLTVMRAVRRTLAPDA